jgi:fatty acid desaturase
MQELNSSIPAARDPRAWPSVLARYREPSCVRSMVEIVITVVPFVVLWILMRAALGAGHWVGLLLAVPAAGFLVRLFMIQHDCGHGSFFRRRRANDWVGRVIGVLTLTPYDFWRHSHALHHANSGNLDHRGFGDVDTLTVREFLALSRWHKLLYRLYRNPIVMFGVGPTYLFVLQHRLPVGLMRSSWHFWLSTMATNLAIAALAATMIWLVGLGPFLIVQLPITLLAVRLASGCSTSSTNSRTPSGPAAMAGIFTRRRCTAAPIMTSRASCVGSPPISGCTTSIISAAVSRITDCRECYGIIQSLLPSGGLRCSRASSACAWFFGTKGGVGLFPFGRCISLHR